MGRDTFKSDIVGHCRMNPLVDMLKRDLQGAAQGDAACSPLLP